MINMGKVSEFTLGGDKTFKESPLNLEYHVFGGKQQHTSKSKVNSKINQKEGSIFSETYLSIKDTSHGLQFKG